jgi:hypothetical protein
MVAFSVTGVRSLDAYIKEITYICADYSMSGLYILN